MKKLRSCEYSVRHSRVKQNKTNKNQKKKRKRKENVSEMARAFEFPIYSQQRTTARQKSQNKREKFRANNDHGMFASLALESI